MSLFLPLIPFFVLDYCTPLSCPNNLQVKTYQVEQCWERSGDTDEVVSDFRCYVCFRNTLTVTHLTRFLDVKWRLIRPSSLVSCKSLPFSNRHILEVLSPMGLVL